MSCNLSVTSRQERGFDTKSIFRIIYAVDWMFGGGDGNVYWNTGYIFDVFFGEK